MALTQNATNSALAMPSDTSRRPEADLSRGTFNAAVEVGRLAVLKPQRSCCDGLPFTPTLFLPFFANGKGQGNKGSCISVQSAPVKYCFSYVWKIPIHDVLLCATTRNISSLLSCCWRERTDSVCPVWQVYPLVHLWRASTGEWESPLFNERGTLKIPSSSELKWGVWNGNKGNTTARSCQALRSPSALPCLLLTCWVGGISVSERLVQFCSLSTWRRCKKGWLGMALSPVCPDATGSCVPCTFF